MTLSARTMTSVGSLPDPDWYFEHVLSEAAPNRISSAPLLPAARWQRWWREQAKCLHPGSVAAEQGFVVRASQLASMGVTRSAARHAVSTGRWSAPAYGVVAVIDCRGAGPRGAGSGPDSGRPDASIVRRREHALASSAAALRRTDHVLSGRSAAVLHGLPTLVVPTSPELTSVAPARGGQRTPSHIFEAELLEDSITSWFGVPVTTIARTLVDLARHDRRDGIMAADAAAREGLLDAVEVREALAGALGWPGVRQARRVLAATSALAESPLESVLRLVLLEAGFPAPVLQQQIGPFRVDLCWPDRRLIVEADGRIKYTDDEFWREKRREQYLRSAGWRVERVIWDDVLRQWPVTSARLWAAYRQG